MSQDDIRFLREEAGRFRDAAASMADNNDRSIHSKIDCADKLDGIANQAASQDNDGCFGLFLLIGISGYLLVHAIPLVL